VEAPRKDAAAEQGVLDAAPEPNKRGLRRDARLDESRARECGVEAGRAEVLKVPRHVEVKPARPKPSPMPRRPVGHGNDDCPIWVQPIANHREVVDRISDVLERVVEHDNVVATKVLRQVVECSSDRVDALSTSGVACSRGWVDPIRGPAATGEGGRQVAATAAHVEHTAASAIIEKVAKRQSC
jgi:hypothetical protein